jgi:hypothetical protein
MTNPPQGRDEQGHADEQRHPDERPDADAYRTDPDRFATQPAPTFEPTRPTPTYGQPTTPYGRPPYGTPSYGQAAQSYGRPTPQYGQPAPQYGQPAPQYGQPQPGTPGQYGGPTQQFTPQYGQPGYGQTQYATPQYATPQYATPQYGGPAAPAEKSKVGLIAIVTGIALLVIAGVVVLVMSLQSTVLDPAAVERDVAAQFEEREGVAVELDCAEDMEVIANATYECSGTTADGESVTLQITITDEASAAYTWTEP